MQPLAPKQTAAAASQPHFASGTPPPPLCSRPIFSLAPLPPPHSPVWRRGLGLLALGAGVGEETLFRAFMQAALCGGIAGAAPGLPEAATRAAGIAVASVIFGWLHALTPTYFFFATGAGALFGEQHVTQELVPGYMSMSLACLMAGMRALASGAAACVDLSPAWLREACAICSLSVVFQAWST